MLSRAQEQPKNQNLDKNRACRDAAPDTYIRALGEDENSRTFQISFSSEVPVARWFGSEILDHSEQAVDLERLNNIGCVLFNHNRNKVCGKIKRAWIEDSRGCAEIEFDSDEESEIIYQKVKNGTLRGVSVGYTVDSWEEVMPGKTSADGRFTGPCEIARRWVPNEISIVSVPADDSVGVGRSEESIPVQTHRSSIEMFERQLQINKNLLLKKRRIKAMNLEQLISRQQELLAGAKAESRDLTPDEAREFDSLQRSIESLRFATNPEPKTNKPTSVVNDSQRAIENERLRIQNITTMCRDFDMNPDEYIASGASEDAVRAAIIEHLRTNKAPISTGIQVTVSEEDKFRAQVSDSLVMRGGVKIDKPEDGARQFMGMSLRDLAIECLSKEGAADNLNRRSSDEIYSMLQRSFYNPTSAFPAILDQTIEKSYKEGHKKANVTFDKFTKKGTLKDFKVHDNYYLAGPVGEFLEVPENGELKHDVFGDAKLPTRKLKTYGRQFTLSRQAFINDDIGLVTSIPARYAASARKTINKQVFEILLSNPAIYDGKQLFGSDHKNLLASGTGVTQEAMQTMILAMTNQKDQFDNAIIINPGQIVVPAGLKFDMYTLFNSPTINTPGNTQAVNPLYEYRNSIEVIEDATINALSGGFGSVMPWFLFGDSMDCEGIEVDYLNGNEIPTIRRMEAPGTLGFVWDIYLDWGISVMDYRGIVKNPGIEVNTKLSLA